MHMQRGTWIKYAETKEGTQEQWHLQKKIKLMNNYQSHQSEKHMLPKRIAEVSKDETKTAAVIRLYQQNIISGFTDEEAQDIDLKDRKHDQEDFSYSVARARFTTYVIFENGKINSNLICQRPREGGINIELEAEKAIG